MVSEVWACTGRAAKNTSPVKNRKTTGCILYILPGYSNSSLVVSVQGNDVLVRLVSLTSRLYTVTYCILHFNALSCRVCCINTFCIQQPTHCMVYTNKRTKLPEYLPAHRFSALAAFGCIQLMPDHLYWLWPQKVTTYRIIFLLYALHVTNNRCDDSMDWKSLLHRFV